MPLTAGQATPWSPPATCMEGRDWIFSFWLGTMLLCHLYSGQAKILRLILRLHQSWVFVYWLLL